GNLDRALFADDALVLHPLVLAAQALVVLDGAENARTEQPVALRLEGAVIDGLRLLDLAVGPGQDLFRAGDRDADLVKDLGRHLRAEQIHQLLVHIGLRWELFHCRRRRTDATDEPPRLQPSSPPLTRPRSIPPPRQPHRLRLPAAASNCADPRSDRGDASP